ncbi:SDR family NAD(P)-dependent oxidoreductase [uncultured Methylobacterium sp.]|jgi:3-hydroxy acid dehydrogenase/malonic semialdehyde reductase|uniref:SDR family NAD(P)-dependent oxidoreductase n=1 Tax=uncultured Methylobacterium sp. TaxID=157278 RepID=UPI002609AC85|nr:SDR family NAD(P)-dependent oxidoreductase [uncultured Methylobacterium sp.]
MIDAATLTVLVTGATSGFGDATCRRFHAAGARVIATGRRADRLEALARDLGTRCHTIAMDVSDLDAVAALPDTLPAEFREIDVCVANAGLALGLSPAQEASMADWSRMIDTNVTGLVATVRAVLPGMVARDRGHVVLVGSIAGDYPYPGGNVYGATKAFVKQFALNLRADLIGANVRVTNIEPGLAETEFSLVRFAGDTAKAAQPYAGVASLTSEDIAETIFWSCTLPAHVNINRLQVMPTMQTFGPLAIKRT